MRTLKHHVVCLLSLLIPSAGFADSSVWRVTDGEAVVYLAGTIHRLPPQAYPLPEEFAAAYEQSQTVVFETDLDAMQSPAVQMRMLELSQLEDGATLRDVLSAPTYEDLEAYCQSTGFPVSILSPLKPVTAMLTLLAVTLQQQGITAPGVDEHFFERARQDDKPIDTLESVDTQIEQLMALDQGDPDGFVRQSVADLRDARQGAIDEAIAVWREGDEQALVAHFLEDQILYAPALYRSLLVERNRDWMNALRRYLDTPETEMVLVGVAHLVGSDGLISLLRGEGYQVTRHTVP